MAAIANVLAELKTVLSSVDPAPQPAANAVWVYPADHAAIDVIGTSPPFLIISQAVNEDTAWRLKARGKGRHRWHAEILLFLKRGQLRQDDQIAAAEQLQEPWVYQIADALSGSMTLNHTAAFIGEGRIPGDLFRYRIGHISWGSEVFWGIRLRLPITHTPSMPFSS